MLLIYLVDRYLRALTAMYIRMTFRAVDVYEMLEPLLKDYRKLRNRDMGTLLFFFASGLLLIAVDLIYRWIFIDFHGRIRGPVTDGGESL